MLSVSSVVLPLQLEEPEQGAGPDQSASSFVPKTLLPFMKRLPVKRVVHVANVTEDPVGSMLRWSHHMRCVCFDAADARVCCVPECCHNACRARSSSSNALCTLCLNEHPASIN